jgi:alanine transaminase
MSKPSGTGAAGARAPALTLESINPAVLKVEYAVRGELALKADEYVHALDDPSKVKGLPFDKVVTANIGNPQQKGLDQIPITFWRQVISLLEYPALMEEHYEVAKQIYPEDVLKRAKQLHAEIGSVGAYTHSKGVLGIRKRVAKFIEGAFAPVRGIVSLTTQSGTGTPPTPSPSSSLPAPPPVSPRSSASPSPQVTGA